MPYLCWYRHPSALEISSEWTDVPALLVSQSVSGSSLRVRSTPERNRGHDGNRTGVGWNRLPAICFGASGATCDGDYRRRHRLRGVGRHRLGRISGLRHLPVRPALTPAQAFFLAVIIAGVVWLKLTDTPEPAERKEVPNTTNPPRRT